MGITAPGARSTGHPEVDGLVSDYWDFLLDHEPGLRAQRGLGLTSIPDYSSREFDVRAQFARRCLDRMDRLRSAPLSPEDRESIGFLRGLAERDILAQENYWLTTTVAPYTLTPLARFGDLVFRPFGFAADKDVDHYLGLVRSLADCVHSISDKLRGQEERQIRVARPALSTAVETVNRLRASSAQYVLVSDERLGRIDAASALRLREGVTRLAEGELASAFDRLQAVLGSAEYKQQAGERLGLAHTEGGESAYRAFVKIYTTSALAPERLHQAALVRCGALADHMAEMRARVGFGGDEQAFHRALRSQRGLFAGSVEEMEARYLAHLSRLEKVLPRWFSVLPSAPYGVRRMPTEWEGGVTFGYYQPPSPADPIGRYRYNASDLAGRSMLDSAALIYHELAPGHHFHFARQAENTMLPPLRREFHAFAAYNEGWAEYAADLGWEMGLYEDPWDAYGRLSRERFSAARVVVDTGLNLGTMTQEQARSFLGEHSTLSDGEIASELLRYAADGPGQAVTYSVGLQEFRDLRRQAEAAAGDRFDIRAFHEALLGGGALPFAALQERVRRGPCVVEP